MTVTIKRKKQGAERFGEVIPWERVDELGSQFITLRQRWERYYPGFKPLSLLPVQSGGGYLSKYLVLGVQYGDTRSHCPSSHRARLAMVTVSTAGNAMGDVYVPREGTEALFKELEVIRLILDAGGD